MICELKNGGLTAKVNSLGAQLVSLRDEKGFEYIWTGDPKFWAGQAPVLFPMVGALRGGKATIGGREVEMGQHGFARRREFALKEQSETQVTFTLCADDETKKMYPFDFALDVTYTLKEDGVETAFCVQNRGEGEMPFAIGGHPGFNVPINEDAAFEDYLIRFERVEDQICPAIVMGQGLIDPQKSAFALHGREIPLRHSLFYQDALVFENLQSEKVQIVNPKSGKGIEMDFAGFPLFGVWSAANDGPYVCLEPWTGCATRTDEGDAFEEKKNMIFLAPGNEEQRSFSVRIL